MHGQNHIKFGGCRFSCSRMLQFVTSMYWLLAAVTRSVRQCAEMICDVQWLPLLSTASLHALCWRNIRHANMKQTSTTIGADCRHLCIALYVVNTVYLQYRHTWLAAVCHGIDACGLCGRSEITKHWCMREQYRWQTDAAEKDVSGNYVGQIHKCLEFLLCLISLIFKQPGCYFNFSTTVMKNVHIHWTGKDKIMKPIPFCGKYNRDCVACLKNSAISLLPKHTKWMSLGVFMCVCISER